MAGKSDLVFMLLGLHACHSMWGTLLPGPMLTIAWNKTAGKNVRICLVGSTACMLLQHQHTSTSSSSSSSLLHCHSITIPLCQLLLCQTGLENGLSEDELIAIELGASSLEDLTEVQRQYVDKLKVRLFQVGYCTAQSPGFELE